MSNTVFLFNFPSEYLVAFLKGDNKARESLFREYHNHFIKAATYFAPDLAERDLAEDIVQEMYALLLAKDASTFDPVRGSANILLSFILRTAVRNVRATFAYPGNRTRLQKDEDGQFIKPVKPLSIDMPISVDDSDSQVYLYDIIPDVHDPIFEADAVLDAEWTINLAWDTAPYPIPEAIEMIYYGDHKLSEAAEALNINRSTLRRHIDQWVDREIFPLVD